MAITAGNIVEQYGFDSPQIKQLHEWLKDNGGDAPEFFLGGVYSSADPQTISAIEEVIGAKAAANLNSVPGNMDTFINQLDTLRQQKGKDLAASAEVQTVAAAIIAPAAANSAANTVAQETVASVAAEKGNSKNVATDTPAQSANTSVAARNGMVDAPLEAMLRGLNKADAKAVQNALLRQDPNALPKYGADGDIGGESIAAINNGNFNLEGVSNITQLIQSIDSKREVGVTAAEEQQTASAEQKQQKGKKPLNPASVAEANAEGAVVSSAEQKAAESKPAVDPSIPPLQRVQVALNGEDIKGKNGNVLTEDNLWGKNTDHAIETWATTRGAKGILVDCVAKVLENQGYADKGTIFKLNSRDANPAIAQALGKALADGKTLDQILDAAKVLDANMRNPQQTQTTEPAKPEPKEPETPAVEIPEEVKRYCAEQDAADRGVFGQMIYDAGVALDGSREFTPYCGGPIIDRKPNEGGKGDTAASPAEPQGKAGGNPGGVGDPSRGGGKGKAGGNPGGVGDPASGKGGPSRG